MHNNILYAVATLAGLSFAAQHPFVPDHMPACNIDHSANAGTGSFVRHLSSTGSPRERGFLVNVPSTYERGKHMGLILSFHGADRTASEQEMLSQFSNETYNPDWITVYPQGLGDSWEGPSYHCANVSDDIQFVSDLLDYMREHFCINDSMIYATGKSNGGGFVGTLACDPIGDNFAAFAPVSGAFYTDVQGPSPCTPPLPVCSPARQPLPIIEFHGFIDPRINYTGGQAHGGLVPSIPSWLATWAIRNGNPYVLEEHTTITSLFNPNTSKDATVYHSSWDCPDLPGCVQGYNISDVRHDWPSPYLNDDNNRPNSPSHPTVLDATQIIMDFFRNNTKPL